MDRQEKKKPEGNSENGSENGSPEDSDIEEKVRHLLFCHEPFSSLNEFTELNYLTLVHHCLRGKICEIEMANSRHQKNKSFAKST